MASIKLGPSGSQTTLPDIVWPEGAAPEIPYEQESAAEESRTLDGGLRVNLPTYTPGTWTLVWDGIVWADVLSIIAAAPFTQQLVFTNEYVDGANHNVYVQSRSYSLKADTAGATKRYILNLTLREVL